MPATKRRDCHGRYTLAKHYRMRVPLELEHLIRSSCDALPGTTLSACLSATEARKALEVENYLRACVLRLEQTDAAGQCNAASDPHCIQ